MFCWTLNLSEKKQKLRITAAVAVGYKVYCFTKMFESRICAHVFNTVSLRWRMLPSVTTDGGNCYHTAVLIDVVYLWGGCHISNHACHNVLHAFDVDTHRWFQPRTSGTVPEGRSDHSACVLEKVMFIYGGWNQLAGWHNRWTNDMHKLDTTTMLWSLINTGGTPLQRSHSATIIGTKMFVFGRVWNPWDNKFNNITRVFDTETNCWLTSLLAMPLQEEHSAFVYNGELIVGGYNNTSSDVWKFNPETSETFSWKKVGTKGKGPSKMYQMCYCMVGARVILLGTPNELYILDLNPSLKTLCKVAVIQYGLEQSGLPHNIGWELAAMSTNSN